MSFSMLKGAQEQSLELEIFIRYRASNTYGTPMRLADIQKLASKIIEEGACELSGKPLQLSNAWSNKFMGRLCIPLRKEVQNNSRLPKIDPPRRQKPLQKKNHDDF